MARNNGHQYHFAALLWRRKKLIRTGINSAQESKSFARNFHGQPSNRFSTINVAYTTHAEMDALRDAQPEDRLEVIRFLLDGTEGLARPCVYCRLRIKRIGVVTRFTNEHGEWQWL